MRLGDDAKELFPGGIEIPYLPGEQKKMFELTKECYISGRNINIRSIIYFR